MERTEISWDGNLDWHALEAYTPVLARRVGDRNEWVVGVGVAEAPLDMPWNAERPCVGYAGYDLKNRFEDLGTRHPDHDGFAVSAWWIPRIAIHLKPGIAVLWTGAGELEDGMELFRRLTAPPREAARQYGALWRAETAEERYLRQVNALLGHIQRGDIYEVNYCMQRTAAWSGMDPYAAFAQLLKYSDAPHAAFLREGDRFALCASPERFFRLEGRQLFTQPMKGTRPRGSTPEEDKALAGELAGDAKERAENIMAVDVARNDFSRVAEPGTVQVNELCSVKTFRNVHQMVSTVRATVVAGTTPADILRATFPMASMTGAPKVRAMQLIEEVEDMRRGLYSGTIGFFLPDGTADLNVVIRTITWDAATGRASLITGGAITAASDPQAEYEECSHKARSVLNAFGHVE
ncbi:MAG TPA: aminodeoxychorismate synthase component I [Flavobacteriales bacterium]|nr:aminodeoxychorismate synthase component I [Flavobacteriales bacterium]